MFKVTFIVFFMILGTLVCASYHKVDCNSCGEECKPACGTKHFKNCCYNYLRKKRAPESDKVLSPMATTTRVPFLGNSVAQDIVEAVDQHTYYPDEDAFDMRFITDY